MIITIKPNNDPNYKEPCNLCQGKGYFEQIPLKHDGENWIQTGPDHATICPRCNGKKEMMADFVMESK